MPTITEKFVPVRQVLAIAFNVPEERITEHTAQADIETWDSLGHLNLMLMLEDRFGITLDIDEMAKLKSVPAIIEFLDAKCLSN
jgi:acyl carrier protein